MKKIIFVAVALIGVSVTGFAQGKTPAAVVAAFDQRFPDVSSVKWEKEKANEYEAEFEWNGKEHSANFSDSGEWLETESPATFTELPDVVQQAFNAAHSGATVKGVEKIETSGGAVKYEVEMKQGVKTVEVFYAADGKEIKQ